MKKPIIIDELENSTVLCDSVPLELTGPILGRYLGEPGANHRMNNDLPVPLDSRGI
jgi:hypothetical protein